MMLFAIQDAYNLLGNKQPFDQAKQEANKFVEALAADENMLSLLEETYKSVYTRLKIEQGEQNILKSSGGGLWHKQVNQPLNGRASSMHRHGI